MNAEVMLLKVLKFQSPQSTIETHGSNSKREKGERSEDRPCRIERSALGTSDRLHG
jgi:hypothetical protein